MSMRTVIHELLKTGQKITTRDVMKAYGESSDVIRKKASNILQHLCGLGVAKMDGQFLDKSTRGYYYRADKGAIETYEEYLLFVSSNSTKAAEERRARLKAEKALGTNTYVDDMVSRIIQFLSDGGEYTSLQIRNHAAPELTASGMSSRLSSMAAKDLVKRVRSYPSVLWAIVPEEERNAKATGNVVFGTARIFRLMDSHHTYPAQTGNTRPAAYNFGL